MSEKEWLQPVPRSIVFDLLQYKIAEVQRGDAHRLDYSLCVVSYLNDMQSRKGVKRNCDYARMWGYSESWVSRNIDRIKAEAVKQARFHEGDEPESGRQEPGKTESRPAQDEARPNQGNTAIPADLEGARQDRIKEPARPPQDRIKTYRKEPLDNQTEEEQEEENPMVEPPAGGRPEGDTGDPRNMEAPDPPEDADPRSPPDPEKGAEVRYHASNWNYQAAQAMIQRLASLDALSGIVKKQVKQRGEEHVIQEWADVFRLLQSQDGWKTEQITFAMRWVLQPDNKWVKKRWLQSATSLRQRTGSGDKTKFEAIYNQAVTDGKSRKDTGETREEADRRIHAIARSALDARRAGVG